MSINFSEFAGYINEGAFPKFESGGRVDEGGLGEILQVPRTGFKYGSRAIIKNALAVLNKNKKNAEYMFKASDNVSPGYAKGDLKYNAELLADQLAEDAGVVLDDLDSVDHLVRTEFYGTAYDYLAKEMGMMLQMKKMQRIGTAFNQKQDLSGLGSTSGTKYTEQLLKDWNPPKGRKPNASGGLAKILEV